MIIIDRSFTKEVSVTTLLVTIVVICLFLVLRGLIFLHQAADGLIPVSGVLSLVTLAMTANLDIIIPLMFFIALIMVLSRWYTDQEMSVYASCGVGVLHFLKPLAMLNLLFGGAVVAFSFFLTPMALTKGYELEAQYRQSNEVNGVITGRFVESKKGQLVYYVEHYDAESNLYMNVFVNQSSAEREGVVVADTAYRTEDPVTQDQFLVLSNGSRYEGVVGLKDYRIIEFEKYAVRIEIDKKPKLYLPIKALPTTQVMNSDTPAKYGEWIWRIAKVFTLPILSIFGLALIDLDHRNGSSKGRILAFTIYLTYSNFLGYAVTKIKQGDSLSPAPALLVNLSFAVFAVYCLYRRNYNLPLIPKSWRFKLTRAAAANH
jgi:lipopolysaccharide export system permease protein